MTMFDMDKETTEGMAKATEVAAEKIEEGAKDTYKAIENGVVNTYKAIENGVVGAYKKVEDTVVDAFNHMTDAVVGAVLTREGETVEDAKKRMAADVAAREEAARKTLEK